MNGNRRVELVENPSDFKAFALEATSSITNDLETSLSTTVTLEVMNMCKTKIIKPFNIMLTMVGWKSLASQITCRESYGKVVRIIDKVLLLFIVMLLVYSYVYEALSCRYEQGTDKKMVTVLPVHITTTPASNHSTIAMLKQEVTTHSPNCTKCIGRYIECNHISSTYVIPSIIHLIAYIMGLVHYRFNDNEDIYGLMEKTLQYSTTIGARRSNHSVVIRMLTFWMCMSALWVLMSVASYILYDLAFNAFASPFYVFHLNSHDDSFQRNIKHFMFTLDFFGYIISSIVTVIIVLNYTLYCELVKFYIDAIAKKIEMRSIKASLIKNDIQTVEGFITLINGMIGKMMTLILILEINLIIVGGINVFYSNNSSGLIVANRLFFVIHLIPLIMTSLVQCVRVNQALKSFKIWGRQMSVFGYRKEDKKQLDSFLLFTMGYDSKVHVMAYPLECWQLLVFFIIFGFAIITLIQTGVMDQSRIFKYL